MAYQFTGRVKALELEINGKGQRKTYKVAFFSDNVFGSERIPLAKEMSADNFIKVPDNFTIEEKLCNFIIMHSNERLSIEFDDNKITKVMLLK